MLVRTAGLEPAQGFPQGILSPLLISKRNPPNMRFREISEKKSLGCRADSAAYHASAGYLMATRWLGMRLWIATLQTFRCVIQ